MDLAQDDLQPLLPHAVEMLALAAVLLGLVVLVVLVVAVWRRGQTGEAPRETRAVALVRWVGILVGGVLGLGQFLVVMTTGPGVTADTLLPSAGLGAGAVQAPIIFGVVVLLAVVVGELVVRPRYDDGPRTADLRPRRVRDHLPPRLVLLVTVLGLSAVALCTFTVLTASADDVGRAGRALHAVCTSDVTSTYGPYPGTFYVAPYAWGVTVALLVAAGATWQVTRRPLGGTHHQADHHRRTSMQAITGALGTAISAPLVGIAFIAGTALLGHACPRGGWPLAGWLALAVMALSLVTLVVSLLALVVPPSPTPSTRSHADEEESTRA